MKAGRNEPCPCGSGKKYKHCCLKADEAATRVPAGLPQDAPNRRAFRNDFPDPMELMLQQAGMSSPKELDAAMERYSAHCESRPQGTPAPSFMEFLGRPNLATEANSELRAKLEGQEFSSRDELEKFLNSNMEQRNATPREEFEGLSSAQMHHILGSGLGDKEWFVQFRGDLPDTVAASAPVIDLMRWLLQYYIDHGGEFRLTASGYYPRALCAEYLRRYRTLGPLDRSIPSESTMPFLFMAHQLLHELNYISESKTKTTITVAGRTAVEHGTWSNLLFQTLAFATEEMDWQYIAGLEPQDAFDFFQDSVVFLLYLLKKHPFGTVDDLLERLYRAFPVFKSRVTKLHINDLVVRTRFIMLFFRGFCEPFGILELTGKDRYRTTELFHQALRWPSLT